MSTKVTEHDLADLIEGRLPADRVADVRSAIERDPALRRAVVAMASDRDALRRLTRLDEASADPDMVEVAIAEAERHALLEQPGDRALGRVGRDRKRHIAAAAALLVFVGLAAVASTLLATKGQRGLALLGSGSTKEGVSGKMSVAADDDDTTQRAAAAARSLPGDVPVTLAEVPAPAGPSVQGPPSPSLGVLAEGWAQEVERKLKDESATPAQAAQDGAAADSSTAPGEVAEEGVSLDRAVALALEGRLRIVCESSDADAMLHRAGNTPGVIALQSTTPAPARARSALAAPDDSNEPPRSKASGDWAGLRVEVRAPLDPRLAALRDRLAALRLSVSTPGGPAAHFAEAEGVAPERGFAPSREVEDVLWWSLPPSAWRPRASVIVTIEVREPAAR